jgi:hypothetical protein
MKSLTSSWKPLHFFHSNTNTPIYLLVLFYFMLYFIPFHLHTCSSHITQLSFLILFQIIFHLFVQNWINQPVKPPIRTNRTHKNWTFKKGRIEPNYYNRKLKLIVFLGSNSPYPIYWPPLIWTTIFDNQQHPRKLPHFNFFFYNERKHTCDQ